MQTAIFDVDRIEGEPDCHALLRIVITTERVDVRAYALRITVWTTEPSD